MLQSSGHRFLREATAAAHAELETVVGLIDSLPVYSAYVRGLLAFRDPVEAVLRSLEWPHSFESWRPTLIADALRLDLSDIEVEPLAENNDALVHDRESLLGTLYVLEGSALGARLLKRDAAKLGLNEHFGARHLHLQTASPRSWPTFVGLLENASSADMDRVAQAARAAFASARGAMLRARAGRWADAQADVPTI